MIDDAPILQTIVRVLKSDTRLASLGFAQHRFELQSVSPEIGIDIIWYFMDNSGKRVVGIELKTGFDTLSRDLLARLESNASAREFNGLILLSTAPSDDSLRTYAERRNIMVVPITPTSDAEWGDHIRSVKIDMTLRRPQISRFQVHIDREHAKEMLAKANRAHFALTLSTATNRFAFYDGSGERLELLSELIERHVDESTASRHVAERFQTPRFIDSEIGRLRVLGVEFDLKLEEFGQPIVIDAAKDLGVQAALSLIRAVVQRQGIPRYAPR